MALTTWLAAAGSFGLLAALVAWLLYRAGRKDVERERLEANEQARKEGDKRMEDISAADDAARAKRVHDI